MMDPTTPCFVANNCMHSRFDRPGPYGGSYDFSGPPASIDMPRRRTNRELQTFNRIANDPDLFEWVGWRSPGWFEGMHIHLRFPIQSLWIKSADALAVREQH